MLKSSTEIEVRYAETDQMGVVYYANYFIWFEVGRTRLMREKGFDYRVLEKEGFFLPVIESHANYINSATYGNSVLLETSASRVGKSKLRFEYLCKDLENNKLVTGYTVHVFMNHSGKPVKLPSGVAKVFETNHEN